MAVWHAMSLAATQSANPAGGSRDPSAQEPFLRVQANLVQVPVFVFVHQGLERGGSEEDHHCSNDEVSAFRGLNADQPWLPRACDSAVVKDLTLDKFRLYQDGEPMQIESVERENWWLVVRDNWTWHVENSDTPSGMWSSADAGQKFLPETSHFYLLSYAPPSKSSAEGCHRIRVEVLRPGVEVLARDEYCAGQTASDLLNGTKEGKKLNPEMPQSGYTKIPLLVQAGALRRHEDSQQFLDVVAEFPSNQLIHSWDGRTGRLYAQISVLGAVFGKDGKLVARFSDLLYPPYWPTGIMGHFYHLGYLAALGEADDLDRYLRRWDPVWMPTRYETQVEVPPGEYTLRVVLSDGLNMGRVEVPVAVEAEDSKALALSSVLLCNRFRDAHVAAVEIAAANFAPQYVPLVSKGVRFTPAGDTHFTRDEHLIAYFEAYDPELTGGPGSGIQAHLRIVDAKSGRLVKDFPAVDAATYGKPGSTVVPIAREIPIANLPNGEYRLEVQASDRLGQSTPWRAAEFSIKGSP